MRIRKTRMLIVKRDDLFYIMNLIDAVNKHVERAELDEATLHLITLHKLVQNIERAA